MVKIKKLSTTIFSFVLIISFFMPNLTSAQELSGEQITDCGQGYIASAFIPAGNYEVYIDSKAMTDKKLKINFQDFENNSCRTLLETSNNNTLKRAGELVVRGSGLGGTFILISSDNIGIGTPNAPKITLRPKGGVCNPLANCTVEFQGENFQLKPKVLNLRSDSLIISLLQPIEADKIDRVVYSIDKKSVYRSSTLETLDPYYIPPGQHELNRTILLKSGQTLTDSKTTDRDFNPMNILGNFIYQYKEAIRYTALFLMLLILILAGNVIYSLIRKRKSWHEAHVANVSTKIQSKKQVLEWDDRKDIVVPLRRGIIALLIPIALFVVTSTFILTTFRVDGESMHPTLLNLESKPLFKFPVTWASINNRDYIPKRGEIVVFNHTDQNIFDASGTVEERYLVKRVLALPGERVVLNGGDLRVYNEDTEKGFNPDVGVAWEKLIKPTPNQTFDIMLGNGEIFVAGDNRNESLDSRAFGPIKTEEKVALVK